MTYTRKASSCSSSNHDYQESPYALISQSDFEERSQDELSQWREVVLSRCALLNMHKHEEIKI